MASTDIKANPLATTEKSIWLKLKPHLVAAGFYTLITLLVAWPVVTNLTTDMIRLFPLDRDQSLWNLWWVKRALLDTYTNPYFTDYLFYPYGTPLYLHSLAISNSLLAVPLQLVLGRVGAFNLFALLSFPLAGYGAYLLARHLLGDTLYREWGALLAGLVYSFGPFHFVKMLQYLPNLVSIQWIPFYILFMLKLEKAATRRDIIKYGLLTALFFLLILSVDYYYTLYTIIFTGLYWIWRGGQTLLKMRRERVERGKLARAYGIFTAKLAGAGLLGTLPFSPILLATISEAGSGKYVPLDADSSEQIHSSDLLQLFLPPGHQPWWGGNFSLWDSLNVAKLSDSGAVLGYVILLLCIYTLFKVRGLWFWVFTAVTFLVLSFGPSLRINDNNTPIPMPYRLLSKLPLANIGRSPDHFILITQLSLGIIGAFGLCRLMSVFFQNQVRFKYALGGLVMLLFFLEGWPGIFTQTETITAPPFTTAIAATNTAAGVAADKAVLELPVTKHGGLDSKRMLYQTFHERPILGGYTSRKLLDPHRLVNDYVLFNWIEFTSYASADVVPAKSQQDWLGLLNYANIGYIVVYSQEFGRNDDFQKAQSLINLALTGNGQAQPYYQDKLATVYKVPNASLLKPVVLLGRGWTEVETLDKAKGRYQRWIEAGSPVGHITIAGVGEDFAATAHTLEIEAVSPDKPRRLQVFLNGQQVSDIKVTGVTPLRLDNLKLTPGDNVIELRPDPADGYFVPASLTGGKGDTRQLRVGILSVKFG